VSDAIVFLSLFTLNLERQLALALFDSMLLSFTLILTLQMLVDLLEFVLVCNFNSVSIGNMSSSKLRHLICSV
jgi:hypothetical protein